MCLYVEGLLVLSPFLTRRPVFSWGDVSSKKIRGLFMASSQEALYGPCFPNPFSMKGLSIPSPTPVSGRGFRGLTLTNRGH